MARASKKAEREGRTIVFIDEAGFYLLAAAVLSAANETPLSFHQGAGWRILGVL